MGIDLGSLAIKDVILGGDGILASSVKPSDDEVEMSARAVIADVLNQAGLSADEELYIVSTGVGGKLVSVSRRQKSIVSCLARGINHLCPTVRMSVDMGAESSTVIKVNERGRLSDWVNHDKCAAGTGVFLQQMSRLMHMSLEEMSELSFQARARADITNTCAVFAESEVISHVHCLPPTPKEDITAGIYASVVSRIISLCKRTGIEREVAVTGGVALSRGLVNILEKEIGFEVVVPDSPQLVAALGAAVIARENIKQGSP